MPDSADSRAGLHGQRPPRMEPLARLPVFLALDGQARGGRRQRAGGRVEGRAPLRGRRRGRGLRRDPCEGLRAVAAQPPGGAIALHGATWQAGDFTGAAIAVGGFDDEAEAATLRSRRPRGRRPGQRDRQARALRLFIRRHRQPLAAGDRHFDRRRGPGIRPGDPRQARSHDPARLCALGRRRAALAHGGAGIGTIIRRAAAVLATVHRASPSRIPTVSRATRFRRAAGARRKRRRMPRKPAASRWSAPGPATRSCSRARGARAAIGRHHPHRRSRLARDPRFRAPRGEEDAGRQAGYGPSCKQDEINALMIRLAKAGKRVVRLKSGDP